MVPGLFVKMYSRRGICLIFENEKFDFNLPERTGSKKDRMLMEAVFRKLQFDVRMITLCLGLVNCI